ncbi:hypothetical protein C5167_031233 [Papaver somniferum]|nr:hypothetical protein C5167_031233 [Papaver somniferum]
MGETLDPVQAGTTQKPIPVPAYSGYHLSEPVHVPVTQDPVRFNSGSFGSGSESVNDGKKESGMTAIYSLLSY